MLYASGMSRLSPLSFALLFAACSTESPVKLPVPPGALDMARPAPSDGALPDLPAPPDLSPSLLTIAPPKPELGVGQTLQLTANMPVTWAILSGSGTVDAAGLFTAAARQGPVVVQAMSDAEPTLKGTVAIDVQPVVELVAGGAALGGSNDGMGGNARFLNPQALTVGSDGIVYIADTGNDTIRRFAPKTGLVTTVAGSALQVGAVDDVGSAARFAHPRSLALDGAGALYVADSGNSTIRRIDLATGSVSTVAGVAQQPGSVDGPVATARLSGPDWLVFGLGRLYFLDGGALRYLDPTAGVVSTVVAAGSSAVDGTFDLARLFDASDLALVSGGLALLEGGVARHVDLVANSVTSLTNVPGTGVMNNLYHLTSNGAGELLICDVYGLRHHSLADGSSAGLLSSDSDCGPLAFVPGSSFDVYDIASGAVRLNGSGLTRSIVAGKTDPMSIDGFGTAARFWAPGALVSDGASGVYVADGCLLRHVDLASGQTVTIAGQPDSPCATIQNFGTVADGGFGVALAPLDGQMVALGGSLYVRDQRDASGHLRKFDLAAQAVTTLSIPDDILGLASDGTHLWAAAAQSNAILELALAPQGVTTLSGGNGSGGADGDPSAGAIQLPRGHALRRGGRAAGGRSQWHPPGRRGDGRRADAGGDAVDLRGT